MDFSALEVIKGIKKYFSVQEFNGKVVTNKHGEFGWAFWDIRILAVVLWIRKGMGIPLVINTKDKQQRGLRWNLCQMVLDAIKAGILYLSAHVLANGVDISSSNATADQIRAWIVAHIDECPYPIRLEDPKSAPTWVHVDVMNITGKKIVWFKA